IEVVREKIPDVRFVFMVQDLHAEGQEEDLKKSLQGMGVLVDLVINNRKSPGLLPAMIGFADACLIPSPTDGGAYVWMEPMASGVPVVIARDALGQQDSVDEKQAAIFQPGDSKSATDQLLYLLENEAAKDKMRDSARSTITGAFDRLVVARLA